MKTLQSEVQLVFIVQLAWTALASRTWGEMFMDDPDDCGRTRRPTHDMSEGDVYLIKSDDHGGHVREQRMPAECFVGFNLGDRQLSVAVLEWGCDQQQYSEPFLAVYADCDNSRRHPLAFLNCSTPRPETDIVSSTSCILLYHYRGHRKGGYFFALHVVIGQELIAFPAGGIAAVVLATVVVVMIVAKVICVATGYERRLPNIDFDADDDQQKQIFVDRHSPEVSTSAAEQTSYVDHTAAADVAAINRRVNSFPTTSGHVIGGCLQPEIAATVIDDGMGHVTSRSNGNMSIAAAAAAELAACDIDLDLRRP